MSTLSNQQARQLAISSAGLFKSAPVACDKDQLQNIINFLGYVQQDPLNVVARAHDHILWSRNQRYKPGDLDKHLEEHQLVFEHFCHDACVLPMETLPYWRGQFERKRQMFKRNKSRNNLLSAKQQQALKNRIRNEGALCSKDFKNTDKSKNRAAWTKPAHKQTLDYLWLTGELAVSKRHKFTKYYDLAERVYPRELLDTHVTSAERLTRLNTHALKRLGFATETEIKHFWDTFSLEETKAWCNSVPAKVKNVQVEGWDGEFSTALMLPAYTKNKNLSNTLTKQIKIINPFDPLVRDRNRLQRVFGFEYRIEIYVPADKRQYGYYVYPLLEYDKFIGRIDVRHDRSQNVLVVNNLWPEPKIKFGKQRMAKLHSELNRLKRFCGADSILNG